MRCQNPAILTCVQTQPGVATNTVAEGRYAPYTAPLPEFIYIAMQLSIDSVQTPYRPVPQYILTDLPNRIQAFSRSYYKATLRTLLTTD